MFALIESARAGTIEGRWSGRVASFAVHSALAAAAVLATQQGPPAPGESRAAPPIVWEVPPRHSPPPASAPGLPAPPGRIAAPALPLVTIDVPGVPGPTPDPGPAITVTPPGTWPLIGGGGEPPGRVLDARYVEEPPARLAHPPLRYPEILRQAGVEGSVVVEAVLDTLGAVERSSIRVVQGGHALFEAEGVALVLGSRYRAARVNGRPVRVRIHVPVSFAIRR